jgi:hypothetical protein
VNKKNTYTIFLIVGLLSLFFIKNKFSHKHNGYKLRYSLYTDQAKSSKSPLNYAYTYTINNEEEDELTHLCKSPIILYTLPLFSLKANPFICKVKFAIYSIKLFLGTPTYLAIKNFRI